MRSMPEAAQQKKRHHYVPVSYLQAFCDAKGCLHVFRKDAPGRSLYMTPDSVGFRKFYYSQPTPAGTVDNNALEDTFSEAVEGQWKPTLARLHTRQAVSVEDLELLFGFMALQKVRVPASRDVTEAKLAHSVNQVFKNLNEAGALPPLPAGLPNLPDLVRVAIDPHQSIHGMVQELQGPVLNLFNRIGLVLVHNTTSVPFLTSDNPVVWFNPAARPEEDRPYDIGNEGPVMLMFPLSPTLLLMGSDEHKDAFGVRGMLHSVAPDEAWVELTNSQICRYAYETVFASGLEQAPLIEEHAALSPVFDPADPMGRMMFGKRTALPKWGKQ